MNGQMVRRSQDLQMGDPLRLTLSEGVVQVAVTDLLPGESLKKEDV
jgi:ribosomal 50S subunit-recycling heat shock protein